MAVTFHIVPHTHWDREWYEPFQTFRARLVDLVDDLLPVLENDPSFTHFMLDGQLAALDDYLEVRPEAQERLRALIAEGRMLVGPWQTLMDEFLVSGENSIRNLRKGLARAGEFGPPMLVGYLPDMFGHISQMPQILARAGIADAVTWRGVPEAIDKTVFKWTAPDGSSVRTAHLATSYSSGAQLPETVDELEARLDHLHQDLVPFDVSDTVLVMNGTDHIRPQPKLPSVLAELNARQNGNRYLISTIPEYLDTLPKDGLIEHQGELRSGARANLLMGVVSNRVDLRRLSATAESVLERYAEPLAALYGRGDHQTMIEMAWDRLIDNAAHDSICACSVDRVTEAVKVRFDEALELGSAVRNRGMKTLARQAESNHGAKDEEEASARGIVAFNPSASARSEVVTIEVTVPDEWDLVAIETPSGGMAPTQQLEREDPVLLNTAMTGAALLPLGSMISGRQALDYWINAIEYGELEGRPLITINVDTVPRGHVDVEAEKAKFLKYAESHDDEMVRILARRPGVRKLAVRLPSIPPLGWGAFRPVRATAAELPANSADQVTRDGRALESRLLRLEVNDDGTVNLLSHESPLVFSGGSRVVDGGDFGDTYNWSPPKGDREIETPSRVEISEGASGPIVASLIVERMFEIPARVLEDGSGRSDDLVELNIRDEYELRSGEPFVRVTTKFSNRAHDHRLRVHFPLPFQPTGSDAGNPFDVTHRGLEVEGGPHEVPLPTFPARGFVDVSSSEGGLAVLVEPVIEYEVIDGELALTLLRSVGMLSRREMKMRPLPAGPDVPAHLAQCYGDHEWRYGLYPHKGDWDESDALGVSERYVYPLEVGDSAPLAASAVSDVIGLNGQGVQISACYRDNGRPTLRLWAGRNGGRFSIRHRSVPVDILGRPQATDENADQPEHEPETEFQLGPFEIFTVAVT